VVLEVKEKKRNPIVTILAIVGVLALLCFCGPALIVAIVSPDTFDEVISNEGISSETTVPASPTTAVEPTLPPDFTEIYRFSGNGRGTTDLFSLQDGIIRVKWTHVGESNFALELHRLDDDSYESLENTIGNAEGQAILKVKASDQYLFEAYWADGPWEVIVEYRP
jgi:hypothetical protein